MELFEERCSGYSGDFVWVGVGEVKCFLETECNNGDSIHMEIPREVRHAGLQYWRSVLISNSEGPVYSHSVCEQLWPAHMVPPAKL